LDFEDSKAVEAEGRPQLKAVEWLGLSCCN
jgi:hypothetical protein